MRHAVCSRARALHSLARSAVPEELAQLAALTRLALDRNYMRELPASLARLRCLQELRCGPGRRGALRCACMTLRLGYASATWALTMLLGTRPSSCICLTALPLLLPGPTAPCSCEGCASLRELPAPLAAALPLRSLNLLHTGVARLPVAAGVRLPVGTSQGIIDAPATPGGSGGGSGSTEEEQEAAAGAAAAASSYLRQLTELRWGVAEWEAAAGGSAAARRWVGASGAVCAGGADLPDLAPLLQAGNLRVLQLAHVPASAEPQLAALTHRLPQLRRLQVNSAVLMG